MGRSGSILLGVAKIFSKETYKEGCDVIYMYCSVSTRIPYSGKYWRVLIWQIGDFQKNHQI